MDEADEPPPRFVEESESETQSDGARQPESGRPAGERPERPGRPSSTGINGDQGRADFLKSLMDGDQDAVPQKVELDLDGIFDQARKEAEQLSPDATRQLEEAPKPDEPLPPAEEIIDVAPLSPSDVKKVARYKMFLVLGILGVVVLGMLFALYRIFFHTVPPQPQVRPFVVEPDSLIVSRTPMPGEFPLGRFYMTLGQGAEAVVVEMEIVLHYRDARDLPLIENELILIRDLIYRLTKPLGPALLTNLDVRRQLQADLLQTLNGIETLRSDPDDPRLTYVQIPVLTRR